MGGVDGRAALRLGCVSAVVLATILLAASLRAEQHVLDLTVPVAAQLDGGGEGCAIGESGTKDADLPVEMGLALDRASYFLGGYVVYDVTLKPRGNALRDTAVGGLAACQ